MKSFKTLVNEKVANRVISTLKSLESRLSSESRIIFAAELESHPTYYALLRGVLGEHFGFIKETRHERITSLVNAIIGATRIRFSVNNGTGDTIAILYMELAVNYEEITGFHQSIVLNRRDAGDLQELPWLKWLLLNGAGPIIMKYHITQGDYPGNQSRSRKAIMTEGGTWGVPTEYSGTEDNNWVTQAMDETIDKLAKRTIELLGNAL